MGVYSESVLKKMKSVDAFLQFVTDNNAYYEAMERPLQGVAPCRLSVVGATPHQAGR
jgi:hypothetical protein